MYPQNVANPGFNNNGFNSEFNNNDQFTNPPNVQRCGSAGLPMMVLYPGETAGKKFNENDKRFTCCCGNVHIRIAAIVFTVFEILLQIGFVALNIAIARAFGFSSTTLVISLINTVLVVLVMIGIVREQRGFVIPIAVAVMLRIIAITIFALVLLAICLMAPTAIQYQSFIQYVVNGKDRLTPVEQTVANIHKIAHAELEKFENFADFKARDVGEIDPNLKELKKSINEKLDEHPFLKSVLFFVRPSVKNWLDDKSTEFDEEPFISSIFKGAIDGLMTITVLLMIHSIWAFVVFVRYCNYLNIKRISQDFNCDDSSVVKMQQTVVYVSGADTVEQRQQPLPVSNPNQPAVQALSV